MTAGADLEVGAELHVTLASIAQEMKAQRLRTQLLAAAVAYVQAPAYQFYAGGAFTYPPAWGPNTGYAWAVQRITVAGFGATTDAVTVYKGASLAAVQPQNALYTLAPAVTSGVATWHPGRTGLVLMGDESLVLGGTFTGTAGILSADVVQLEVAQLPFFLL